MKRKPIKKLALILMLCSSTAMGAPAIIEGLVTEIQDGDTLTILDVHRNQHRIRLSGIDAPELGRGRNKPGQPYGYRSKQSLSDIAGGREVRAECETEDRYGRKVCTIFVERLNANLEQVKRGMAMVYRKYTNDPAYIAAESEARAARRGLWSDPAPIYRGSQILRKEANEEVM